MFEIFHLRAYSLFLISSLLLLSIYYSSNIEATEGAPLAEDPQLSIQAVFNGLQFPTGMALLKSGDILVLEKNEGTVHRIVDGKMVREPLLDVNVATASERGMLGIAVAENQGINHTKVFLYFTEAQDKDGGRPIGNRVYSYNLTDNKLVNPVLLLDLPSTPGPMHNGGALLIGPDNNLYVTVGDVLFNGNIQKDTSTLDGRSGILRISLDGQPVPNGAIIGNEHPLDMYYAYGIRNSFGIDFDPVTGRLWDTENGPDYGDEINLVEPGFNSGWGDIQGSASSVDNFDRNGLLDFNGNGRYSEPEFVWNGSPVGPTALKFLDSDRLGKNYENDLFVGDFHGGNLYNFNLNEDRTDLYLGADIDKKTADTNDELRETILARNLGAITDIEVGPDGYLYILSLYQGGDNCGESDNEKDKEEEDKEEEDCIPYSSAVGGTIFQIYPSDEAKD